MNAAQFKKSLASIKKGQARFTMIHDAACFALEQINSHGQTTPANQLIGVMHKADRVEALKTWFKDFGKCKEIKDGSMVYVHKKELMWDGEKIENAEMLAIAEATPYFELTKEIKPASSYDVMKGIRSILARAKATRAKGLPVDHEDLLEKLKVFIPAE